MFQINCASECKFFVLRFALQMKAKKCYEVIVKIPMFHEKFYFSNNVDWGDEEIDTWSDDESFQDGW